MTVAQNLYAEIKVWKRISDREAVRYTLLQELTSNRYQLQSADSFRLPLDENQMRLYDRQLVQSFIDNPTDTRSDWFDSIEAALTQSSAAQDLDFS